MGSSEADWCGRPTWRDSVRVRVRAWACLRREQLESTAVCREVSLEPLLWTKARTAAAAKLKSTSKGGPGL